MQNKRQLVSACRHFVLDMDGTFYLGNRILEGSIPFLESVEETGRDYLFFTNNSSKSPEAYLEKLRRMGCPVDRSRIMTSGDVTIRYLREKYPGKRVFLLGTPPLEESFSREGIILAPDGDADVVVVGFDTGLTYAKLAHACSCIRSGAVFLATHLDINCPVENGFIPDVGSFCALITASTGCTPRALGKPHRETVDMIVEKTGWKREEIAFVGDRIYTDIATGVNNGCRGLLVLSGEADMDTVRASAIKPDGIFRDLGEIGSYLEKR